MANPLRTSFAELCRDTRLLLDITQEELSTAVGISRSHPAEIETAPVNPTLDVVSRIGDALGLELQLVRPATDRHRPTSLGLRPLSVLRLHRPQALWIGVAGAPRGRGRPRAVARLDRPTGLPSGTRDSRHRGDQDAGRGPRPDRTPARLVRTVGARCGLAVRLATREGRELATSSRDRRGRALSPSRTRCHPRRLPGSRE